MKTSADYTGLTVEECAKACCMENCVISGKAYCAHPRKGGLHDDDKFDPETIARLERASAMLGNKPTRITP